MMQTGITDQPLTFLACAGKRLQRVEHRSAAMSPTDPPSRDHSAQPAVRLPHAPALDGLRALAVVAVLLYHAGLSWLPGGFLGVEIFFVISGYLITSLLLAEWSTTGRIDLAGFWLRRARRLLPALFALLLGVVAFAVIFLPDEVAGMRGDAVSGALYVNNWYQIFSHKSYFESAGRPSLLRHLWSLAVEEQFYLLWPLLFVILMRWSRKRVPHIFVVNFVGNEAASADRRQNIEESPKQGSQSSPLQFAIPRCNRDGGRSSATPACNVHTNFIGKVSDKDMMHFALGLTVASAAASALGMAMQYAPDADPSRIYFGTDTRASGILIGEALAFLLVGRTRRLQGSCGQSLARSGSEDGRRAFCRRQGTACGYNGTALVTIACLVALGELLTCLLRLNEFQSFLYRGGFVLTSLATTALIAAAVQAPDARISRIFAWAPLRWIGVRSYGIYLWHFPIFMVTRPQLDVACDGIGLLAARLALTVLIAALSYQCMELPIRQGILARVWHVWRAAQGRERSWLTTCGLAAATFVTAPFLVFGALLITAEAPPPPAYLTAMQAVMVPGRAGPLHREPVERLDPPQPLEAARAAVREAHGETPAPYLNAPTDGHSTTQLNVVHSSFAPPASNTISGTEIVAIGDSVMLGVRDELLRALGPDAIVDAEVGRQARHALAAAQKLRQEGKIRPIVILHIGANGFISAGMFDQIMAELADARQVLIVNVKVPRSWETPNNKMLAEAVRRYPNAVLVDWHAASENRPEIFWKDGHHLRPKGAVIYANLIAQALRDATLASVGQASYTSIGNPSGSAKNVNLCPVNSSTRIGSAITSCAWRCATYASMSSTSSAR